MRKRRSPKGAGLRHQFQVCRWARPGLVGGFLAASAVWLQAQSDKGVISDRQDRVEHVQVQQADTAKADAEVWAPAKIVLNLDARCPVVLTLGYFGAFATNDKDPAKAAELQSKYAELQKALQPIAGELKQMAVGTPFVGQKFPAVLNPRLDALRTQLYGIVLKLYGDAALDELKQYAALAAQGTVASREQ